MCTNSSTAAIPPLAKHICKTNSAHKVVVERKDRREPRKKRNHSSWKYLKSQILERKNLPPPQDPILQQGKPKNLLNATAGDREGVRPANPAWPSLCFLSSCLHNTGIIYHFPKILLISCISVILSPGIKHLHYLMSLFLHFSWMYFLPITMPHSITKPRSP